MQRYLIAPIIAFFGLLSFNTVALAQNAAAPDGSSPLGDYLSSIVDAIKHGQWALGGSIAVVLLMALAKRYLPDNWGGKYVRGDGLGGVASTFVLSFFGALMVALTPTGATVSAAMALAAAKFAVVAIGGYVALHKLATSLVNTVWWQEKAPGWLRYVVSLALNLIGSPAIKKAEAAGQAAVAANPPAGANGAAGTPTSI